MLRFVILILVLGPRSCVIEGTINNYPYWGCYDHESANPLSPDGDFLDNVNSTTVTVRSLSECINLCEAQGSHCVGLSDPDCSETGAQSESYLVADCHCGFRSTLPQKTNSGDCEICSGSFDGSRCGRCASIISSPAISIYGECAPTLGGCHYYIMGDLVNWEQAETECSTSLAGAHLASIRTVEERLHVEQMLSDEFDVWIGLHSVEESTLTYIWKWSDGSSADTTIFADDWPSTTLETCGRSGGLLVGMWDYGLCAFSNAPLCEVCEGPTWGSLTSVPRADTGSIIRGFIYDNGGVFYSIESDVTAEWLSHLDVLLVLELPATTAEQDLMISWVENGGKLIFPFFVPETERLMDPFNFDTTSYTEITIGVGIHIVSTTDHFITENAPTHTVVGLIKFFEYPIENPDVVTLHGRSPGGLMVRISFVLEDVGPGRGAIAVFGDSGMWYDENIPQNQVEMESIIKWAHSVPMEPIPAPTPHPTPDTTASPTLAPTASPTLSPTLEPTLNPTPNPTATPSLEPASNITPYPTSNPTPNPTTNPTPNPTANPTPESTSGPTAQPTPMDEEEEETESGAGVTGYIEGDFIENCYYYEGVLSLEFSQTEQEIQNCNDIVGQNAAAEDGITENNNDETENNSKCTIYLEGDISQEIGVGIEVSADGYVVDSASACFMDDPEGQESIVSESIIAINGDEQDDLHYEFALRYEPQFLCSGLEDEEAISCRWYDVESGEWNSSGCELVEGGIELPKTHIRKAICRCDHLTAFAILQDTVMLRDKCSLSTVLGHTLWLVFAVLYGTLFACAWSRLMTLLWKYKEDDVPLEMNGIIHILLVIVAFLNALVSLILYIITPNQETLVLQLLSTTWAFLNVMSYWIYALVVATWVKVLTGGSLKHVILKRSLIAIGISISVVIFVMFISSATATEKKLKQVVFIGSIMIAILCIVTNICFVASGVFLVYKLDFARRTLDVAEDEELLTKMKWRIIVGLVLVCSAFLAQTLILLASILSKESFFHHFGVYQSLYMGFDMVLLSVILFLFFMNTENSSVHGETTEGRSALGREQNSVQLTQQETYL